MAALAQGETERPPGFVRGVLTANSPTAFSVRTSAGITYQYRTDAKTWIERDHERVRAANLLPGETLEVVSDRDPDPIRYARMVHVISPPAHTARLVSASGDYRLDPAAALPIVVFTGLVANRDRNQFTLRTRFDGEKTIYLHPDTQCLENGNPVDPDRLLPNTRVSVTAVQNADRELEAYRIVWGSILEPEP